MIANDYGTNISEFAVGKNGKAYFIHFRSSTADERDASRQLVNFLVNEKKRETVVFNDAPYYFNVNALENRGWRLQRTKQQKDTEIRRDTLLRKPEILKNVLRFIYRINFTVEARILVVGVLAKPRIFRTSPRHLTETIQKMEVLLSKLTGDDRF